MEPDKKTQKAIEAVKSYMREFDVDPETLTQGDALWAIDYMSKHRPYLSESVWYAKASPKAIESFAALFCGVRAGQLSFFFQAN